MKRKPAKIKQIRAVLESISCLCAEGPEFLGKLDLCDIIQREVLKGISILDGKSEALDFYRQNLCPGDPAHSDPFPDKGDLK